MILPNVWIKVARILKPNNAKNPGITDSSFRDEEIVFSKNNVCVHSTTSRYKDTIHYPGYLTVSYKNSISENCTSGVTLRLSWIANTVLWRKNQSTVESNNIRNDFKEKPCQQINDDFNNKNSVKSHDSGYHECCTQEYHNCSIVNEVEDRTHLSNFSEENLKSNRCDHTENTLAHDPEKVSLKLSRSENNSCQPSIPLSADTNYQLENRIVLTHLSAEERKLNGNHVKFGEHVENGTNKAGICDNRNTNLQRRIREEKELDKPSNKPCKEEMAFMESNDSSLTLSPCRSRSDDSNSYSRFSVDLDNLKSLRLFFKDSSDSGQLVITSKENQYKILHFHQGGLQKLSDILQQWNVFTTAQVHNVDGQLYKHFKICQPQIKNSELHPEEGAVPPITEDELFDLFNESGQIEDDTTLRKRIFFEGLPKRLRKFVWPFLLNCYPYQSTYAERNQIRNLRRRQYEEITNKRKELLHNNPEGPMKTIEYLIEKDVVRTDRSNPFYAGDDNPNVSLMKDVLMNYAVYDHDHTYMQGMSDLLAPVLVEIPDEAEAFWCFVDIVKRGLFACTPTDSDMEKNLLYLRELIRVMQPEFYTHLESLTGGMDLLFCHRWLLLCFKREFPEDVVLRMWEACWSNFVTDYFHLFICMAIISVYADDIVKQNMKSDDMLYHFNSLAMCMDGTMILKKARGLLYAFRMLDEVPLSLAVLCEQRGSDIWDSRHVPVINC